MNVTIGCDSALCKKNYDSDVYAALAYYHDRRQEIRQQIREDEAFAREMQAQTPSLLQEKIKNRNV